MNSILATYFHARTLIQRDFWPLVFITVILQFPSMLISEVHAHIQGRPFVYWPIFLFGCLLSAISDAAVLSVLARNRDEKWISSVYQGVISYTWALVRVELNQFGIIFIVLVPFLLPFSRPHFEDSKMLLVITSFAILIAASKLAVGQAIVVREKANGRDAVNRAWKMTSGSRFRYGAGCLVVWSVLGFFSSLIAEALGPLDLGVLIGVGVISAAFSTIETVVIWCIYSQLLLLEAHPSEITATAVDGPVSSG